MADIKVSSEQLDALGSDVVSIATQLDSIIAEAEAKVGATSSVWEGLAHNAYMGDYAKQKETLVKIGEIVTGLGKQIKGVAQQWKESEAALSSREG